MVWKKRKLKNWHRLDESAGSLKHQTHQLRGVGKEKDIPHQAPNGFRWLYRCYPIFRGFRQQVEGSDWGGDVLARLP